jgi:hypothetical protein
MTETDRAARDEAQRRGHAIFDPIAEPYLALDGVDIGRMFGSEGLRVRGKICALVGYDGYLMLKLPESRADALVADGTAARMVMAGREMREWLKVEQDRPAQWAPLVAEAYAYLDEITP